MTKLIFKKGELLTVTVLSGILFIRLFGVFVVLPIFSIYSLDLLGATPFLVGLAFGAYAITQAFFQIPFGAISDYWSRKWMLIIGLSLFGIGCLISGGTDSIYIMIIGRLIQGSGAISAIIYAIIGDNIRSQLHVRSMAILGISAGLAFAIAFSASPFLGQLIGLSGIFNFLATMSISMAIILLFIPIFNNMDLSNKSIRKYNISIEDFINKNLIIPLGCNFVSSFGLASFMFHFPLQLENLGVLRQEFWKYYLPLLFLGLVTISIAAVLVEKYNKLKSVFIFALFSISISTFIVVFATFSAINFALILIISGYIFFIGFNIFEPILPTLVLKNTNNLNRGKASGMLAMSQFGGSFFGSVITGATFLNTTYLPFVLIFFSVIFLLKKSFYSKSSIF